MKRITGLCEVCRSSQSKYKCPGCELLSCSLSCSKSHKKRTGCTGMKRIDEVPVSQFDDNLVLSDYNLLMEAKRLAESSRRMRESICGLWRRKQPFKMHEATRFRKFHVAVLPGGMSRGLKNKTFYCGRRKSILWTIEWRFNSTDIVLVDHYVNERTILSTVITKHLEVGPWKNQLKPFCNTPLGDLKFFLKKNARASKPLYRQLDINRSIGEQLASTVILEYPVMHVYLPSDSYDFEVDRWTFRLKNQESPSLVHPSSLPSPPGTPLREEEIEEGEVSPTRFLDVGAGVYSAPSGVGGSHVLENATSTGNTSQMPKTAVDISKPPSSGDGEALLADDVDWYTKIALAASVDIVKQPGDFSDYEMGQMPRAAVDISKLSSDEGKGLLADDVDWYTKIALAASDIDKQPGDFSDYEMDADDCLVLKGLDGNYGEETEKSLCFAKQFLLGDGLEEGEISG